jgi:hypothetical protein
MIDVETASQLLDFGARIGQGVRATEQLEGAVAIHNTLEKYRVAYIADEVGMGKTYVALGAAALFRHFQPDFRILVISPNQNIQLKWMKEFRNFVAHNVKFPDLRVATVDKLPARSLVDCDRLTDFVREIASFPAIAKQHYYRPGAAGSHARITCEMVRAYVAQIGLVQAKAMAQAAGMTASEEREAVQCLEKKI